MSTYNKIFISYAKEDYQQAIVLYEHLKELSYEPWLDKKKLLPGSNWDLEINRALKESDFIILLLSSTSVSKRGYVQKEYKLAMKYWETKLEDDIYIIPVLLDKCTVPENLSRFQWIMFEDAFPSIIQSLEKQRNAVKSEASAAEFTQQAKPVQKVGSHDFTEYDITLITLLSQGLVQKHIPQALQEKNLHPTSLSSVEKRLTVIKDALSLSKNEQLVAFCKDVGII